MTDPTAAPTDRTAPTDQAVAETPPDWIGRYRVDRLIGSGGFGRVYLARDEQLQRPVAVKVPHARLVARPADAEAYLAEARAAAGLDHPHIVPVYDVGAADRVPCYVVSKYIDGTDLAARLGRGRVPVAEAVALVAAVSDAVHHAHTRGLVHRDVKPGNILLDRAGTPFVADFGLALRDRDVGTGPGFVGTPAYMSPEQARGEGHRVDGRSDVFSLGVVLYELLTGRRPFQAAALADLLDQIAGLDARPPRQWDAAIPKDVERVCLKALNKRASDRYTTARDLAEDLRLSGAAPAGPPGAAVVEPPAHPPPAPPATPDRPARVVPKGLRAFDAADADFFLDLVPGPRDRDGLPDALRFWKGRVEAADPADTFPVGLLYGPSGCGKSSLVRAGLLPRLADVTAVYVEATADGTEAALLRGVRRQVAGLPAGLGLAEALAAVRRGQCRGPGRKVLLVLDQFEQWLHARRPAGDGELVQSLRQCDGGRVQALLMVRDDFWLAVSRLMQAVDVPVREGENARLVDLFDPRHARAVLAAFGRAFGALPDPGGPTPEQAAFLDRAVAGLAPDGAVAPVRLALFAETVKGRPWTPAALTGVGGAEGVGVTFLREAFAAPTAPPPHRLHRAAAQAVLRALLPGPGADLKGHLRSRADLRAAAGYAARTADFDDLLRLLDGGLRLITPADPTDREAAGEAYYQLTHDYLVPAVREWLAGEQQGTRRGRAELLLADRAAAWAARPEARQLPTLGQWARIRWLTRPAAWTPPQKAMMARAGRYHARRAAGVVALVAVAAAVGLTVRARVADQRDATRAAGLVRGLLNAETAQVPAVVADLAAYRRWADPLLRAENDRAAAGSRQELHTSLALLPVDPGQVDYLCGRLLAAGPADVPVLRDALAPYKDRLLDRLWAAVGVPPKGDEPQRLRAGAALARYDPAGRGWAAGGPLVVADLVRENPVHLGHWAEALRPVRAALLAPLAAAFRDRRADRAGERAVATSLLADYAADDPADLAGLLADADDRQFAALFPKVKARAEEALPVLAGVVGQTPPPEAGDEAREDLAKRQANAAAALLKLGRPAGVWPLFAHAPDPRARSYLVHRLGPLGAGAGAVARRVADEPDVTARRALVLSLGEFGEDDLPAAARAALLPGLRDLYRTHPDPGLHASAEWVLRAWGEGPWVARQVAGWAQDGGRRDGRAADPGPGPAAGPQWAVNGQGQTTVVFPGPVAFRMGTPAGAGRGAVERPHARRIGRAFAVAAHPVTWEQYLRSDPGHAARRVETEAPTLDCPVTYVSWPMAARYCNWLSRAEGLPEDQWCYEVAGGAVTARPDALGRTGYRLPTEAELEYATRAGAATARFYGETDELLPKYAWFQSSAGGRSWPAGGLKPNDFGLFDAHGNVYAWCHGAFREYPPDGGPADDVEGAAGADPALRVLRGGSFFTPASSVRSAARYVLAPTNRTGDFGIRVARTLPPGPGAARPGG